MYGLVNQGIKDLVINKFGEAKWNEICEGASSPTSFVSMQYYDDQLTYRLVGAASKVLNVSAQELLQIYGNFWVHFTAKEGYGPIMDLFGSDFRSFLKNLNHLHTKMGMSLPNLKPPSFNFIDVSQTVCRLEYTSERKGLSHMMIGLIHGVAGKFQMKVKVTELTDLANGNTVTFEIVEEVANGTS